MNNVEEKVTFVPTVCFEDGTTEKIEFCCIVGDNLYEFYTAKEHYMLNGNTGVFYKAITSVDGFGHPEIEFIEVEGIKEIDIYG